MKSFDLILSNGQIAAIESFCAEVRSGLDSATFEDKRWYFELLDVRGRLALEKATRFVVSNRQDPIGLGSRSGVWDHLGTLFAPLIAFHRNRLILRTDRIEPAIGLNRAMRCLRVC